MGHVQNMFDKCVCIYIYIYHVGRIQNLSSFWGPAHKWEIILQFLVVFSSNGQAPAKEVFEMTAECGGACPN